MGGVAVCKKHARPQVLNHTVSLSILMAINSRWNWVSRYQNVSILDFVGAMDDADGGDNCSYKTCKAPGKMSSPTNQHPACLQAGRRSCRPTNSVKALKGKLAESRFSCVICHQLTLAVGELPCFFGRSTVNLCSTSRVLPDRLPNSAQLPSMTMKPNLLSSASRAVNAFTYAHQ